MSIADWSDEQLNALRLRGDPPVDGLVARLYEQPGAGGVPFGRAGFNHILSLTDQMQATPELVFANDSELYRQLHAMPPEFVDYFDPLELPPWVDAAKLALASRLWADNSLGMLVVLFLGSLPACYLMARGIPALYRTDKLRNPNYISQRIYETGLMLEAVLGNGGFKILTDVPARTATHPTPHHELLADLNQVDPAGAWTADGTGLHRQGRAPAVAVTPAALAAARAQRVAQSPPKRFLWGAGYVTTKKVRFLHASMRYLLQHSGHGKSADPAVNNAASANPPSDRGHAAASSGAPARPASVLAQSTEAWDAATLGLPVNQEDLAYTLLTFGYVILAGLEQWGCQFSGAERHAFLHLWRVVGHVLGVEDALMTDDWDEAGRIYRRIQKHQAGGSDAGIALTTALREFIEDYLPPYFGADKILPPLAIRDLVGAEAALLLPEAVRGRSQKTSQRALWWAFRSVLRAYYWVRNHVLRRLPGVTGLFANLLTRVAEELIESCRGAYAREPFFVPVNATKWLPQHGASPRFLRRLKAWRRRVFNGMFVSLGALFVGVLGAGAAGFGWWLDPGFGRGAVLISGLGFVVAYVAMNWHLPRVFAARPTLAQHSPVEPQG